MHVHICQNLSVSQIVQHKVIRDSTLVGTLLPREYCLNCNTVLFRKEYPLVENFKKMEIN